jgi:hypothetical protein
MMKWRWIHYHSAKRLLLAFSLFGACATGAIAEVSPQAGGLQARLELPEISLQEPVRAILEIHNTGDAAAQVNFGGNFYGNIAMTLRTPSGVMHEPSPPHVWGIRVPGVVTLPKGSTYRLPLLLNKWFPDDFSVPGEYTVQETCCRSGRSNARR